MSRPYLCMDVVQRWKWMGGDLPDYHRRSSPIEAECRDAWAEAEDRWRFETSPNLIQAIVVDTSNVLADGQPDVFRLWLDRIYGAMSLADGTRLLHTGGPR